MEYEKMGINLQWKKNLLFAGVFIQENLLHSFLILKKANNSVKRIQRKGNLFTKLFSVNLPKMKSTFIIPCQLR